jgi:predicted N-formylglutamate amidohydrolase
MTWASERQDRDRLLAPDEPAAVRVLNPAARSSFLLLADHAAAAVPRSLAGLGLAAEHRARHIALDLGVAELATALAHRLEATLVAQRYSRLVIDCNREPGRADAIPGISDGTTIPGNLALAPAEREARIAAIHRPYHAAIAGELARRDRAGEQTIVVALHSFTPALATSGGDTAPRPWHAGVLYGGGNQAYALAVLRELEHRAAGPVGDNQPYAMDGIDHTIPHHCFAAGRRYAELEIRQDLLTAPGGAAAWAELIAGVLTAAAAAA